MSREMIALEIKKGFETLSNIVPGQIACSAVAGWKCTDNVLLEKEEFLFRYNSDCRGTSVFRPIVNNQICAPQIPVTMPTYDEIIGRNGISDKNYNEHLLSLISPGQLNVLTIHAEVEGISKQPLFLDFLERAKTMELDFVPLGNILDSIVTIPTGTMNLHTIPGREGTICTQAPAPRSHPDLLGM